MQKSSTKCETCERPATTIRRLGDDTIELCDRCNEQMDVRDAFDEQLPTLVELEQSDPEKALDILAKLQQMHRERDHDGWLDRSVRAHRAHILTWNDRHDEALRELRELRELLIRGSRDYAENQQALAFVMNRSGRPSEAIAELEQGLIELENGAPDDPSTRAQVIVSLLVSYAQIARQQEGTVSARFAKLFADAVATRGIPIPPDVMSASLIDAILFAHEREREASRRFRSLSREVKGKSPEVRAALLHTYLSTEEIGAYRDLARRVLEAAPE